MEKRVGQAIEVVPRISAELLRQFMEDVFVGVGVPKEDAETIADVLITADLANFDSHGVSRLKPIYNRIRTGFCPLSPKSMLFRKAPQPHF